MWDQQIGEDANAYFAFMRYRDIGDKGTLLEAYQQAGHTSAQYPSGQWTDWSATWRWEPRRDAYWIYVRNRLSGAALEQAVDEVKVTTARQLRVVRTIQSKGVTAINGVDPTKLTADQTLRYLTTGLDLERKVLSMDRASSTVQSGSESQSGQNAPQTKWELLGAQLESMSIEELRDYRRGLIRRLKALGYRDEH